ncbi:MAG: PAS domain S-box protein [Prolixibacteraceae bacterium]
MNTTTSKILIVDDNTFYLKLLKTILNEVDAEIYMAGSGMEALKLIHKNDFALAILDIQMPDMDGFELAGQIRKMNNRDLVPIIFLTAYFSDELQMFKGYDHGAIDYLTKPVNKIIFLSKVKIFLHLDQQKKNLIQSKFSIQKSKIELENKQNELKMQNITLRHAQAETEESRKKYIKLYDFAPTGYFTINKKGIIEEINYKGGMLLGEEPSSLINRNFKEFISEEMSLILDEFLVNIFNDQAENGLEIKLKSIKNKTIYVFLQGALTDKRRKCLLSMVDITDRKEAQIALQESEELYHSLLKTSPDGIILIDLTGKITEASDIAMNLISGEDVHIEGMSFRNFVPRDSLKTYLNIYRKTLLEGMVQNHEIKLNRVDKTEFAGEISVSQIKGPNNELKAFMAVIRNISERKLFEKQLRHSERMAGIGELATGMAHEINQPLNTISLIIDNIVFTLENQSLTEDYLKTKINKIFDNINRIKKIIDHVRTFSRDQDDFSLAEFSINQSIHNSVSMLAEQIINKDIKLTFNPDASIPKIMGNVYRFEQVILNMLVNAKDAIDDKKRENGKNVQKRIDIYTKKIEKQIIIEIKDNGTGIDSKIIDKVILPFFTTKPPGRGTGLGLSISYGIIKELGGDIEIKSNPKIGTSIFIKLPGH